MAENHPIQVSDELIAQWWRASEKDCTFDERVPFTLAAQYGADQELLACGNYLKQCAAWEEEDVIEFYNYRRPRPPSLKEQALSLLDRCNDPHSDYLDDAALEIIRRALGALPND